MDTEYRSLLEQELTLKKRALQQTRLKMARYGINAPVEIIIEEEDLAKEVRGIELQLGAAPTPTIQERRATRVEPRYVPPQEPEPVFQERMRGKDVHDRQGDIAQQRDLLSIHRRTLAHLRAQMKELGAFAPPYVRNSVQDAMREIANRKGILRGMGQEVDDLPGDE